MDDVLINYGSSIKSLETDGDLVTVGAHGILWGTPLQRDVVGDYFTKSTYLGATKGVGVDTMLHHGMPLKAGIPELQTFASRLLPPTVKAEIDDTGLLVATVLDLRDKYQQKIYEMCEQGLLSWSSGANPRAVQRAGGVKSGEITQWPLIEFSYTPTPAEPRMVGIQSVKSLVDIEGVSDGCIKAIRVLGEFKSEECITKALPEEKLSFADHSEKVLAAVSEFSERVDALVALRANSRKTGKVLSQNNYDRLTQHHSSMKGIVDDMGDLLEQYKPVTKAEGEEKPESQEEPDYTEQIIEAEARFKEQSFNIDEVLEPVSI